MSSSCLHHFRSYQISFYCACGKFLQDRYVKYYHIKNCVKGKVYDIRKKDKYIIEQALIDDLNKLELKQYFKVFDN